MKQILAPKTHRQLELVELLFENEWITFPKASELLDVPTKTIKTDVHELELIFEQVTIETSKKYGIRLIVEPCFSKVNIYQTFLKNSIEFQIIEGIFSAQSTTMSDLADELYISLSTFKRIIARINRGLQVEGFVIDLKKMQLTGDPFSICNFMRCYYKEKYVLAENLLSTSQLTVLDQVLLNTLENELPEMVASIRFPFLNKLRISAYTVILFLEKDHGERLGTLPKNNFKILANSQICADFYRQFSLHLTSEALSTILYPFFEPQYIRSVDCLLAEAEIHPHIQRQQKNISLLIKELEKKTNCPCTKFDTILLNLYNLENQLHGRTYIFHDTNKDFHVDLVHNYGNFISDMIQSLQAIFYRTPYKEYIVYEAFFILFTQWPDFLESLERSVPSIKAGMLYDASDDFVEILAEKTNYYLNNRFICKPLKISSIAELETIAPEFDCIITNIPDTSFTNVPVIVTSAVFDVKSFDKLMLFYENFFNI